MTKSKYKEIESSIEWRLVKPQQQDKTQAEACTPTLEILKLEFKL